MSPSSGITSPTVAAPLDPILSSSRALYLYIVGLILVPVSLFTCALFTVPTHWYDVRADNSYLANMGYGESLHNASCDILIYGDSSALVDVAPIALTKVTGLSACNIAEFAGVTMINGMMVPDHFLASNPRPRFMLFLYAPENLGPSKDWTRLSTFEAISFRLRYQRDWAAAVLLARHPAEFFSWLELGIRTIATRFAVHPMSESSLNLRAPLRGQFLIDRPSPTACEGQDYYLPPDAAWIRGIREKYSGHGSRVLVDAAPIPDCDPTFHYYRDKTSGLIDNTLEQYPLSDYTLGGRLHMNAIGSERLTKQIGEQINEILSKEGRP